MRQQTDNNALQLAIWREAGRHIQLEEAIQAIANVLADHLPVDRVVIQRLDRARSCLETLVAVAPATDGSPKQRRAELSQAEADRLVRWCRRGDLVRVTRGSPPPKTLPRSIIADLEDEAIVAGLSHDSRALGVIILVNESSKPFTEQDRSILESLVEPFSVALENDRRVHELATLRDAAEADKQSLLIRLGRQELSEAVIGAESGLRPVMERVDLVAKSDVPVLILGETGSGKEVIARAIHTRSARHGGPFIRVNCGAISPGLIDSELFGHERGSFTGATATRQCWFERADDGTLFLDEIGELPPDAQVRLLRILQDGTFERVGGGRQITVDVRVIAATHRDLPTMIDEGKFREDLWYRVAVFPVRLPPLRERTEDIAAMAAHFAVKAARRFGLAALAPSSEDIALLTSYAWPGNVRELAAVMDRAAILGGGERLEVATALGQGIYTPAQRSQATPAPAPPPRQGHIQASIESLDRAMASHIQQALQLTHGRVEGPYGAGRLLQINPHTLRARMRKLGVNWKKYHPTVK